MQRSVMFQKRIELLLFYYNIFENSLKKNSILGVIIFISNHYSVQYIYENDYLYKNIIILWFLITILSIFLRHHLFQIFKICLCK